MLKRFQLIQGVGAFSKFNSPRNGVDFSKNTIVYAYNGYGKSTLATILKSAYLNDPPRIHARMTLTAQPMEVVQKIVIKVENGTMVFHDGGWFYNPTSIKPEILVFDQQYVFENLFVQKVESEHKQSIHRIIIGQEGVQISEELTEAKASEKSLKQAFDEHKKKLTEKINNTGRKDYLNVNDSEETEVISELQDIDSKLTASKEKDELSSLAKFPSLSGLEWDFSEIRQVITDLSRKI